MATVSKGSKKIPTFISLFSGCGGFDYGFIQNGFDNLGAYDIDAAATKVYESNFGVRAYNHDLSVGLLPNRPGRKAVDVVIAGSPCQGFSTAGNRQYDDPRNELLLAGGRHAVSLGARVFVAENVTGVNSGEHRQYWFKLEKLLRDAGYYTTTNKIDCAELGLAQIRKRMILVAWRGRSEITIHWPRHFRKVLKDVLQNINGAPNHRVEMLAKGTELYQIASRIGQGQKLCNVRGGTRAIPTWEIPEVFGNATEDEKQLLELIRALRRRNRVRNYGDADPVSRELLAEEFGRSVKRLLSGLVRKGYLREKAGKIDLTHTFNGKFRRLSWEHPSPTVDTRFGDPRYFLHPDENRGLTVREAARIQGFPDNFVFSGTLKQQYQMIGNAVPPPVSLMLAEFIKNNLL